MKFTARVAICLVVLPSLATGLTFYDNHRYNREPSSNLRGYSGLHKQMMTERQQYLLKFIGELNTADESTNDFKPKEHIKLQDIAGVLPNNLFKADFRGKVTSKPKATPIEPETGESQNVLRNHQVWSEPDFTPERVNNHKYETAHRSLNLYEKSRGKVRVHTYRGPKKDYWILPVKGKAQQKTYSPWGYYVKQPVASEHDKFHSPLHLSFQFD